ncbi:ubiquitin activating enzyme [Coprinopsis cinerea okayama7|uniref:NEDD8-activating enzyme E1 regulatory subunit n=1 Tax=Coprinopsis cinerea (strain Okayama-7 / 130 / ATCC MYA-4618 / FGSC 9003) TaxID=240176 RepID=A8NM32_COPC7|nr:ubiquitin activating enzyme [Coprinopsis cinerea okayama7\|eukprot:XP_001834833.2 ubiquitin activating enzyme [Coprinopsis cinerea okayama7\
MSPAHRSVPDQKTRRYDRQLRLWASSGQSALESAHILVLSSSYTSTSILKNLVLPGIGAFTILDKAITTPSDAGNNFFLEGLESVGKPRAQEAVRLLLELNDGVKGHSIVDKDIKDVLSKEMVEEEEWLKGFSLIIAHNLEKTALDRLSALLWADVKSPPLAIVRSAGFLAEVFIQFHEHAIIESHLESSPSLRIDKPFPALLEHSLSLDFENMDVTDHGHIPYVYILVRVLEEWRKTHDGNPPRTPAEKKEFKSIILNMRKKADEENFEEAESQAFKCWTETVVPSDVKALFSLSSESSPPHTKPFHLLLKALERYTTTVAPHTLPLSATLPDMKSSTNQYVGLQKLYKERAVEERNVFKAILDEVIKEKGEDPSLIDDETIDSFVKHSHILRLLKGKKWGWLDESPAALTEYAQTSPKQLAIHLALSALASLHSKHLLSATQSQTAEGQESEFRPTLEALTAEAKSMLPEGVELDETEFDNAIGEAARSPTADLPNTAALLGGVVAQEVIKMITKQYVPIEGYCTIDLVETWTGMLV